MWYFLNVILMVKKTTAATLELIADTVIGENKIFT